jgi:hypothetical protein
VIFQTFKKALSGFCSGLNLNPAQPGLGSVSGFRKIPGSGSETLRSGPLQIILVGGQNICRIRRFEPHFFTRRLPSQVMKWVEFSVDLEMGREVLSVASKTKYTLKQRQYKLFAVVYHNGREASKGHYVTDIYHTGKLFTLYPAGGTAKDFWNKSNNEI